MSYFICRGPHKFAECLQKKALNAIKLQEGARGGNKGNKGEFEEEDEPNLILRIPRVMGYEAG